jgi:Fic family protein
MKPYKPQSLPLTSFNMVSLVSLIGAANAALARYDGLLMGLVNPAVMLSPLTSQEAVLSSKIEGTQATVEEVLGHQAGEEYDQEKQRDIQEILNYRKAMILGTESLNPAPHTTKTIRLSLIQQLHALLMDSVRGQDKTPGEFRKDQNWIGTKGCTIEQASFVPPNPLQLQDHLLAWEHYLASHDIDPIVQTAIVHAQFELLHPFKDGNGRIGRLLIPLFLYSKQQLSSPMFYLSEYLEQHRDEYYQRLSNISKNQDWEGWVTFFLQAVITQATDNRIRLRHTMQLYDYMKIQVRDLTRSQHSAQMVDILFDRPIFTISDFAKRADIPKPTCHKLIKQLEQEGIITIIKPGAGRRASLYSFAELLNTLEGRQVV